MDKSLVGSEGRRNTEADSGFVRVRGAREHNLKDVSLEIPRNALVVFTGVSGSGKSSLAFGTLYAEAQRRYLESVSPYARRLFHQMAVPEVDSVEGLPPAVALQQQRGSPTTRSSVGSVTTLSNLLRMLYSRAGDYPPKQPLLYAELFSPNTPEGACPNCHGIGRVHEVDERSLVPDDTLTIRERAVAAWPSAWQGQNLRDILVTLGYDVDRPWRELPKKDRDWILFTDEQPTVPVYAGYTRAETKRALKRKEEPSYQGTFTGARKYVLQTFATTQSAMMKRRVTQFLSSSDCPVCKGKRLKPEPLSVTFAGLDIAELSRLPLKQLRGVLGRHLRRPEKGIRRPSREGTCRAADNRGHVRAPRGSARPGSRLSDPRRSTPTLSPGELQRLRLATQVRSNLFGVVYVLDEPSAGLHPADTEALLRALERLKSSGNSLFVVEHELDVVRHADWIVDVGPDAGAQGGQIMYSGPLAGLADVRESRTRPYLFDQADRIAKTPRDPRGWLKLRGVTRNNLDRLDGTFPWAFSRASREFRGRASRASSASSLSRPSATKWVSAANRPTMTTGWSRGGDDRRRDHRRSGEHQTAGGRRSEADRPYAAIEPGDLHRSARSRPEALRRDQAGARQALRRGQVLLQRGQGPLRDMPGRRVRLRRTALPAERVCALSHLQGRALQRQDVGGQDPGQVYCGRAGYDRRRSVRTSLRRRSTATIARRASRSRPGIHPSGAIGDGTVGWGGATRQARHRIAARAARRTLYVLDEPTTGLHPSDVAKLMKQLDGLVEGGNTVIVVEHDMSVTAASDWIIDIGPGAGDEGGRIVASGPPKQVASVTQSRTAKYLASVL